MTSLPPATASNFEFLRDEFSILYTLGKEAEFQLYPDLAASLSKLPLYEEELVDPLFTEHLLVPPVDNTQHHRLGELKRQGLLPRQVEDILYLLNKEGECRRAQQRRDASRCYTPLIIGVPPG